jgi:hypothetical protein
LNENSKKILNNILEKYEKNDMSEKNTFSTESTISSDSTDSIESIIHKEESKEEEIIMENNLTTLIINAKAKHSNIPLLYGLYEGELGFYIIYEFHPFSLQTIIHFSRMLISNQLKRRFIFYQIMNVNIYF